jgi:hypothetical protein
VALFRASFDEVLGEPHEQENLVPLFLSWGLYKKWRRLHHVSKTAVDSR